MKQTIILLAALILIVSSIPAVSDNLNVKIIDIEGSVTVIKDNGTQLQAQIGQVLTMGDRIITGSKSICDIEFAHKTYSRLGEMSDMVISQANLESKKRLFGTSEKKQINLNLSKGNLLSKVKKLGGSESFSVKTPTAVVGVRGTIFNTSTGASGTNVSVFQGSVIVTNLNTNVSSVVPAGQSLSVSSSAGASSEQSALPPSEIKAISEITGTSVNAPVVVTPSVNIVEQLINNPTTPIFKETNINNGTVIINFK
ncbi:FecR domain-containing protein [Candidatus Dependentiae bacterium]|nr:FecR domain-containing protein [Candidatus Dependentiae bacterium]